MSYLLRNSNRKLAASIYNFRSFFIEKCIHTESRNVGIKCQPKSHIDILNYTYVQRRSLCSSLSKCWKCTAAIEDNSTLFCKVCQVILKPKETHYFDVIGVKKSFDVNAAELTSNFRKLQSQLHPDKFTQKSQDEKEISENYSMLLNTAYKTLLTPLERGLYLLELEGYPLHEGEISMSSEFLFEVMEINEELDEVDNIEDLQHVKDSNNLRMQNLLKEVGFQIQQQDWNAARNVLGQVKYFANIHNKIKEKEGNFGC